MNSKTVGVIGLGLMGTAMTERLLEAGFAVYVYNRTRQKADPLLAQGAQWADNPIAICDRVILSLYTTEVVEEVLERMQDGLQPGKIIVDTTTGDPQQTAELGARLDRLGVRYLDAPISGSSQQTRRGEVTVIAGGQRETYEACRDLFDRLAARSLYVGPWGSGARMKLVTNLVLGLNRAALAEGLSYARAVGRTADDALTALMESMAYSRIMETKGQKMVRGDFQTQARLSQHLKDIRIILDSAADAGIDLPLSRAHCRLLELAEKAGYGEADNSAIIRAFDALQDELPQVERPPDTA
jgi:3-hydroxyisobutyrate dehydrogenase-like beta-hydroxyacid dehydrogenase